MTVAPSRLALANLVFARLSGDWLTVYLGEVPADVPLLQQEGVPDPSGRVASYAVIFPGAGAPTADGEDLASSNEDLDWGLQVTVAAGFVPDVLDAADFVHGRLHHWVPTGMAGISADGLVRPPGFDPGPVRRDRDFIPNRFWLPLQYRLTATS